MEKLSKKVDVAASRRVPQHVLGGLWATRWGYSQMMWSVAARGDLELLRVFLVRRDALSLPYDADGASLLHVAAVFGHLDMARFLMESGAGHDRDDNGYTPLIHAAWRGHVQVGELLLEGGASHDP